LVNHLEKPVELIIKLYYTKNMVVIRENPKIVEDQLKVTAVEQFLPWNAA